jgi:hypothetical protein
MWGEESLTGSPECLVPRRVRRLCLVWTITFNSELWTFSSPLYSIRPSLRNLFMKKLIRERVVPTGPPAPPG